MSQNMVETELEWLLYQLWQKGSAKAPTFSFQIADTVILRSGLPIVWYCSSPEGAIKCRKKSESLRISNIVRKFLFKAGLDESSSQEEAAATSYSYQVHSGNNIELNMGYHQAGGLYNYMVAFTSGIFEGERPQVMQAHVPLSTERTTVFKVTWTPSDLQVTKIVNRFDFADKALSLTLRSITSEDESQEQQLRTQRQEIAREDPLYKCLFLCMQQMHVHVKRSSSNAITSGNFFFKIDETAEKLKPILVFATQISSERPTFVLNSQLNMSICPQLSETVPSHMIQRQSRSPPKRRPQSAYAAKGQSLAKSNYQTERGLEMQMKLHMFNNFNNSGGEDEDEEEFARCGGSIEDSSLSARKMIFAQGQQAYSTTHLSERNQKLYQSSQKGQKEKSVQSDTGIVIDGSLIQRMIQSKDQPYVSRVSNKYSINQRRMMVKVKNNQNVKTPSRKQNQYNNLQKATTLADVKRNLDSKMIKFEDKYNFRNSNNNSATAAGQMSEAYASRNKTTQIKKSFNSKQGIKLQQIEAQEKYEAKLRQFSQSEKQGGGLRKRLRPQSAKPDRQQMFERGVLASQKPRQKNVSSIERNEEERLPVRGVQQRKNRPQSAMPLLKKQERLDSSMTLKQNNGAQNNLTVNRLDTKSSSFEPNSYAVDSRKNSYVVQTLMNKGPEQFKIKLNQPRSKSREKENLINMEDQSIDAVLAASAQVSTKFLNANPQPQVHESKTMDQSQYSGFLFKKPASWLMGTTGSNSMSIKSDSKAIPQVKKQFKRTTVVVGQKKLKRSKSKTRTTAQENSTKQNDDINVKQSISKKRQRNNVNQDSVENIQGYQSDKNEDNTNSKGQDKVNDRQQLEKLTINIPANQFNKAKRVQELLPPIESLQDPVVQDDFIDRSTDIQIQVQDQQPYSQTTLNQEPTQPIEEAKLEQEFSVLASPLAQNTHVETPAAVNQETRSSQVPFMQDNKDVVAQENEDTQDQQQANKTSQSLIQDPIEEKLETYIEALHKFHGISEAETVDLAANDKGHSELMWVRSESVKKSATLPKRFNTYMKQLKEKPQEAKASIHSSLLRSPLLSPISQIAGSLRTPIPQQSITPAAESQNILITTVQQKSVNNSPAKSQNQQDSVQLQPVTEQPLGKVLVEENVDQKNQKAHLAIKQSQSMQLNNIQGQEILVDALINSEQTGIIHRGITKAKSVVNPWKGTVDPGHSDLMWISSESVKKSLPPKRFRKHLSKLSVDQDAANASIHSSKNRSPISQVVSQITSQQVPNALTAEVLSPTSFIRSAQFENHQNFATLDPVMENENLLQQQYQVTELSKGKHSSILVQEKAELNISLPPETLSEPQVKLEEESMIDTPIVVEEIALPRTKQTGLTTLHEQNSNENEPAEAPKQPPLVQVVERRVNAPAIRSAVKNFCLQMVQKHDRSQSPVRREENQQRPASPKKANKPIIAQIDTIAGRSPKRRSPSRQDSSPKGKGKQKSVQSPGGRRKKSNSKNQTIQSTDQTQTVVMVNEDLVLSLVVTSPTAQVALQSPNDIEQQQTTTQKKASKQKGAKNFAKIMQDPQPASPSRRKVNYQAQETPQQTLQTQQTVTRKNQQVHIQEKAQLSLTKVLRPQNRQSTTPLIELEKKLEKKHQHRKTEITNFPFEMTEVVQDGAALTERYDTESKSCLMFNEDSNSNIIADLNKVLEVDQTLDQQQNKRTLQPEVVSKQVETQAAPPIPDADQNDDEKQSDDESVESVVTRILNEENQEAEGFQQPQAPPQGSDESEDEQEQDIANALVCDGNLDAWI